MKEQPQVILFINALRPATFSAISEYEQLTGQKFEPVVLVDCNIKDAITARNGQLDHLDRVRFIAVDFDDAKSIREALFSIKNNIFAVVSQYENSVLELKKLVPYLPYLPTPTESSLVWATEKKFMRDLMRAYDETLVPYYKEVHNVDDTILTEIETQTVYPLIIKPSGLEGSLLVSKVENHDELKSGLEKGFIQIQDAYNVWIKRQKPFFLVEEFMDGDMFSIDVYINELGDGVCTPIVEVITGKKVGYDDFFGYMRRTPVHISDESDAQKTAIAACHALGLRSVTAHVELMRLTNGTWKIIELGPRIGGYRHDLYKLSFGINHIMNDILIRADEKPIVPKEARGYSALFNIYGRSEGTLMSVGGVDEVKKLSSFVSIKQVLAVGEKALFAKHNGDQVFDILLFNENKEIFDAECEKLESLLTIVIS
jgi:hypothetical protein